MLVSLRCRLLIFKYNQAPLSLHLTPGVVGPSFGKELTTSIIFPYKHVNCVKFKLTGTSLICVDRVSCVAFSAGSTARITQCAIKWTACKITKHNRFKQCCKNQSLLLHDYIASIKEIPIIDKFLYGSRFDSK